MADLREAGLWLRSIKTESWIVLGLVVAVLLAWELIASQFAEAIIPSMGETFGALLDMLRDYRGGYIKAVGNTVQNYYLGLGLAVLLGWALAGLMGLSGLFARVMKVVLDFLGNIPLIAFMPLLVALLGLGNAAKIIVVMLAALIVIATSAYAAFEGMDRGIERAAMGLGANKLQAHLRVVWPPLLAAVDRRSAAWRSAGADGLCHCRNIHGHDRIRRTDRWLWLFVQHAPLLRCGFDHHVHWRRDRGPAERRLELRFAVP